MEKASQEALRSQPDTAAVADSRTLALRIKRSIRRQTGGEVESLQVVIDRTGIRLQGRCLSFYCKQLAQTAAMRLGGDAEVVNEIEVCEAKA